MSLRGALARLLRTLHFQQHSGFLTKKENSKKAIKL